VTDTLSLHDALPISNLDKDWVLSCSDLAYAITILNYAYKTTAVSIKIEKHR
jgi:hypothetical protein